MPGIILAMARRAPHYEHLATAVSFSHYVRNAVAIVPEDHNRVTWGEKSAGVLKAMPCAMLEREPTTLPLAASAAPLIAAASQHAPVQSRPNLYALSVSVGEVKTRKGSSQEVQSSFGVSIRIDIVRTISPRQGMPGI